MTYDQLDVFDVLDMIEQEDREDAPRVCDECPDPGLCQAEGGCVCV